MAMFLTCAIVAVAIVSVGVVWTGRILWCDIQTVRQGKKYDGTCSNYKVRYHGSGHDIGWVNEKGQKQQMCFMWFVPAMKYPKRVTVYDTGVRANIGAYTLFADIPAFLLTLGILALTIISITDYINML